MSTIIEPRETRRSTEAAGFAARKVEEVLGRGNIRVNGSRPWDIQIHDNRFFGRVLRQEALGLGESYVDGWWDAERLDEFFDRLLRIDLTKVRQNWTIRMIVATRKLVNRQRKSKAYEVGERHYDRGNDLYEAMLDRRMTYSCGYWRDATSLDEAQEAKLDLICRKIGLQPGMTVLDIGCGWGSFALYAAEQYGVHVVGINNSKEQTAWATERLGGLPVEIKVQDYRDVQGLFDRIVSVGMFEHVGPQNHRTFMEIAHRCLADDGLFLLHTIGNNRSSYTSDRWTDKYIFPGSVVPSIKQIGGSLEGLFTMEDWHNFGADYDRTLMSWFRNFDGNWGRLRDKYGERFYRTWKYYLLSCAGAFRCRRNQLWQVVLSKKGVPGGYVSVR